MRRTIELTRLDMGTLSEMEMLEVLCARNRRLHGSRRMQLPYRENEEQEQEQDSNI